MSDALGFVKDRVQTNLASNEVFTDTETDLNVVSTAGFQAPCMILVGKEQEPYDSTVAYAPELIWVTEVVDGTTLRTTLTDRGLNGTAVRTHDNSVELDLVATLVFSQTNWERLAAELDKLKVNQGTAPAAADPPSTFPLGFHTYQATTGNGYPLSGTLWVTSTPSAVGGSRHVVERLWQETHTQENPLWRTRYGHIDFGIGEDEWTAWL